jgi:hypothetical protein
VSTPPVTVRPAKQPAVVPKHKPKHKARPQRKPKQRSAVVPKPVPATTPVGATENQVSAGSKAGFDVARPLIITVFALAIGLFAVASVPARIVRWRTAAQFIYDRHVDLTVLGLALLATAGIAIFLASH